MAGVRLDLIHLAWTHSLTGLMLFNPTWLACKNSSTPKNLLSTHPRKKDPLQIKLRPTTVVDAGQAGDMQVHALQAMQPGKVILEQQRRPVSIPAFQIPQLLRMALRSMQLHRPGRCLPPRSTHNFRNGVLPCLQSGD